MRKQHSFLSLRRIGFTAPAILGLVFLITGHPLAKSPLNLVYVESNIGSTTNGNSIFAFSNDGSGHLTAVAGSPFLTNGTGVYTTSGLAFDGDQQVWTSPDGNLLFAVNGHSDTVSVFNINSDGSLTAVSGSPFASGGLDPISVGLAPNVLTNGGSVVIVVNKDADPNQDINASVPNYTNFTTDSSGFLTPVPNGTIALASGALPSQAYVPASDLGLVFGVQESNASQIQSFRLQNDGTMVEVSAVTPPEPYNSLGLWSAPTQALLYVGFQRVGLSEMGVYPFSPEGVITGMNTATNQGRGLCWLRANSAGNRLYASEAMSGSLTVYDTTIPNRPKTKQQLTVSNQGHPTNISLDPTGKFLYVLTGTHLHIYSIGTDGTLSENVNPVVLNVPTGNVPLGVAVAMK